MSNGGFKTMMKTSESDPIRIAGVNAGMGTIGVTFAPGKNDGRYGGPCARDLDTDLDAIAARGAEAVVTLLEPDELRWLGITRLGDGVERRGMEWLHMPIRDVSTPGSAFEARWPVFSRGLRARLDAGDNILVHCRGGIGRAGTIAARLLAESGVDPNEAIRRVRVVRPGALETTMQEERARTGQRLSLAADRTGCGGPVAPRHQDPPCLEGHSARRAGVAPARTPASFEQRAATSPAGPRAQRR